MKLYIWNEPYAVSYGSSFLFVVAESLELAREQATKGNVCAFGNVSRNDPIPNAVLGEPTRILDLPCAEWHEWFE